MKQSGFMVGGAVLVIMLSVSVAQARDGGPRGAQLFERFDADGNGEITRAEFEAARQARFEETDTDNSGTLSAAELTAAASARHSTERIEARVTRMIERFDENGDGTLSQDEMPEPRRGGMFERIDTDGNGVITKTEAENMRGRFGRKGRDG